MYFLKMLRTRRNLNKDTVFTVTACFFPGLRGRQKDCSANLILRTPMCTRHRQEPTKCEWKRGDQLNS